MGRRCCALVLPMSDSFLQPRFAMRVDFDYLTERKHLQKKYYNRCSTRLESITPLVPVVRRMDSAIQSVDKSLSSHRTSKEVVRVSFLVVVSSASRRTLVSAFLI